jgi:hypothetical protein
MSAAANGDIETALPGEPQGGRDVGGGCTAGDQRREAVDRAVPDPAMLAVGGIVGADDLALEAALELAERGSIEGDLIGDGAQGVLLELGIVSRYGLRGRVYVM